MKVTGVIAEYNPFHNGHKYQLDYARKETQADYMIVVMSGDFVQRGEPAILDKHTRAKMALQEGADLVLELPSLYSTTSAEGFAHGAVNLLNSLGIVDTLAFGSELGELAPLSSIAKCLLEEPPLYKQALRESLQAGYSFPTSRSKALLTAYPALPISEEVLMSPNNILGIEYIKALYSTSSSILPVTLKRHGEGYHSLSRDKDFCSATALRSCMLANSFCDDTPLAIPSNALSTLRETYRRNPFLTTNDFSSVLHYKLLSKEQDGFTEYLDVNRELSDRIKNTLYDYSGYQEYISLLKSKELTYTRISRCLLHILLEITKEEVSAYTAVPYIKILGFRKEASALLGAIKANADIPMLSKLSEASETLSPAAFRLFENERKRSSIYESTAALKANRTMINEYRKPIITI